MTSLLAFACITDSFRNVITKTVEEDFIWGFHFGINFESFFEEHKDPGIFDKDRARQIEAFHYKKARQFALGIYMGTDYLFSRRRREDMYNIYRLMDRRFREFLEEFNQEKYGDPIAKWGREFIAQYGEEP